MYNHNINVLVQSDNQYIESVLSNITVDTDLNLLFHTAINYPKNNDAPVEVLIVDTDFVQSFDMPLLPTKPLIVFVSKQSKITAEFAKKLHLADACWLNFDDEVLMRFNFEKLLAHIGLQKKLFVSNNYLDVLIENVPDLIWFKDLDGVHLKVNNAFCETVGKSKDNVEGHSHYHIWDIPKEVYEKSDYVCLDTDQVIIASLEPQAFDEKVFCKKGLRQFITSKAPLFDEHQVLVGTMGCAHDVTEFKNISTELGMILDNLPFAILVEDNQGHILNANERFLDLFNPTNKTLLGRKYSYDKYLLQDSYQYIESDNCKEIILSQNNQNLVFSIQVEPLYDFFQNPLGSLHIYRDITLERSFENKMRQLAYTDQLTGLYQRRYVYELEKTTQIQDLNLLYIDLDNFKYVNDNLGHLAGDDTLCEFANLLKELFVGHIVARIGGDEFAVIIKEPISVKELQDLAQMLVVETVKHFNTTHTHKQLSTSIGIACASPENTSFDILFKKADKALYKAKNIGKNCYTIFND